MKKLFTKYGDEILCLLLFCAFPGYPVAIMVNEHVKKEREFAYEQNWIRHLVPVTWIDKQGWIQVEDLYDSCLNRSGYKMHEVTYRCADGTTVYTSDSAQALRFTPCTIEYK